MDVSDEEFIQFIRKQDDNPWDFEQYEQIEKEIEY